jgi:hypothetical protein
VSPQLYLILVLAVFAGVIGHGAVRGYLCRGRLRALARQWNMHFAPGDRLRLSQRAAMNFPIPGAANIRVRDLFFRTEESRHQYLFTVDYTVGVIRGKVGRSCVAGFQEPVSRGSKTQAAVGPMELIVAPYDMPLVEAYQMVLGQLGGKQKSEIRNEPSALRLGLEENDESSPKPE